MKCPNCNAGLQLELIISKTSSKNVLNCLKCGYTAAYDPFNDNIRQFNSAYSIKIKRF